MDITITPETVEGVCAGDVFKWNGKRYRIQKRTRSAISVTRYYWFDAASDWIVRRVQAWRQK
jgi:hypothetical protein